VIPPRPMETATITSASPTPHSTPETALCAPIRSRTLWASMTGCSCMANGRRMSMIAVTINRPIPVMANVAARPKGAPASDREGQRDGEAHHEEQPGDGEGGTEESYVHAASFGGVVVRG